MKRFLCLMMLILLPFCLEAKLPDLTERDINEKINEIMKSHVTHKQLSSPLIKRIINNFIDELDPGKVYFSLIEVQEWIGQSDGRANELLIEFKQGNFTVFQQIHSALIEAINRRKEIERSIQPFDNDYAINPREFYQMDWAEDHNELTLRLQKIKTLQMRTAEKLEGEIRNKFLKHIEKRRAFREEELVGTSEEKKKQLIYAYILKAAASSLDSQTAYFTPDEATGFMIQVQQRLFGIGIQLRDDLSGFMVVKIIDGGPASLNTKGLKVRDRIVAVDSEPVVGMDITEAVDLIRGKEGTTVTLTILRPLENDEEDPTGKQEEKIDIKIVRGEVVLKETRIESSYEPFGDGIIAHIKLFSFYQDPQSSSASDLYNKFSELQKDHKINGVILDLRNNSGGILPQAVAVAGLFIGKGIVVSIKDNDGQIHHLRNIEPQKMWNGPLVILINRLSASAAEIVAQALQDYGRALVVGDDHSFGKGTFQTFTLDTVHHDKVNPKGEYKVTRGMYYTVSGKSPQLVGVKSDVVVPGYLSEMQIGEQYSKYPLENAAIKENFDDDLADIPQKQREYVRKLYKFNLQPKIRLYIKHREILQVNSDERVVKNKNYQNFLIEIKEETKDQDIIDVIYGQNDLQFEESINVMKDLILLIH